MEVLIAVIFTFASVFTVVVYVGVRYDRRAQNSAILTRIQPQEMDYRQWLGLNDEESWTPEELKELEAARWAGDGSW